MFGQNTFTPAGGELDELIDRGDDEAEASDQVKRPRNFWKNYNSAIIPRMHEIAEEENEKHKDGYRSKEGVARGSIRHEISCLEIYEFV